MDLAALGSPRALYGSYDSAHLSDVVVELDDGGRMDAHQIVLYLGSEYLCGLIDYEEDTPWLRSLTLDDFAPEIIEAMLHFMYGGLLVSDWYTDEDWPRMGAYLFQKYFEPNDEVFHNRHYYRLYLKYRVIFFVDLFGAAKFYGVKGLHNYLLSKLPMMLDFQFDPPTEPPMFFLVSYLWIDDDEDTEDLRRIVLDYLVWHLTFQSYMAVYLCMMRFPVFKEDLKKRVDINRAIFRYLQA